MSPRNLVPAVIFVLFAGAALAWWRLAGGRRTYPPPFPCIATAKTGWLTAVTSDAMLRLEWGNGQGLVSVGNLRDPVNFKPRNEAEVRALALEVLEPISAPIRSSTADKVSLFAGCDGVGAQWKSESLHVMPAYRECLRPSGETRPACLWRIFKERGEERDEAAGAVADRILAQAAAAGVIFPIRAAAPTTPYAMGWHGPRPPSGPPSLLDRVIDKVSPPPAPPVDEVY
jgi:hypothetical protein